MTMTPERTQEQRREINRHIELVNGLANLDANLFNLLHAQERYEEITLDEPRRQALRDAISVVVELLRCQVADTSAKAKEFPEVNEVLWGVDHVTAN